MRFIDSQVWNYRRAFNKKQTKKKVNIGVPINIGTITFPFWFLCSKWKKENAYSFLTAWEVMANYIFGEGGEKKAADKDAKNLDFIDLTAKTADRDYASAMVTSTSTPGSMLMLVICLTISDGLWRSMRRLWIRIWNLSQVLEPSPHGVLRVVMRRVLFGRERKRGKENILFQ